MKQSPRAWLLARHQAATPSLHSARRTVLAETLGRHAAENAPVPTSQLLRALFFPDRRLWTALATTWLLLLSLRFAGSTSSDSIAADSPQLAATPDINRVAAANWFANRDTQLHALLR